MLCKGCNMDKDEGSMVYVYSDLKLCENCCVDLIQDYVEDDDGVTTVPRAGDGVTTALATVAGGVTSISTTKLDLEEAFISTGDTNESLIDIDGIKDVVSEKLNVSSAYKNDEPSLKIGGGLVTDVSGTSTLTGSNSGDDSKSADSILYIKQEEELFKTFCGSLNQVYTRSAYKQCMLHSIFKAWKYGESHASLRDNRHWILYESDWVRISFGVASSCYYTYIGDSKS